MSKNIIAVVFALGLLAAGWVGYGFIGTNAIALAMTMLITGTYLLGSWELRHFRVATASLHSALARASEAQGDLPTWLGTLHPSLQNPVRARIEGDRIALPAPALTPYLIGLLVMLGMLGTFLGMVVTFKGAVFALEASSDLAAIRAALAEPIRGLGMSFGTSVAGVATSAMLGLMSAISRRERLDVARRLDGCIANELRPLSKAQQREDTLKALQDQAQAMPEVVDRLQALLEGVEQRHAQLNAQLAEQQQQFHREASGAYTALAETVGQALKHSLAESARLAGEAIRPVAESAMSGVTASAQATHERLLNTTQAQLASLAADWSATAERTAQSWQVALQNHEATTERMTATLDRNLQGIVQGFDQRASGLVQALQHSAEQTHAQQVAADAERLAAWHQALEGTADRLADAWQRAGTHTLAQQKATCEALEAAAGQITGRASEHVSQTLAGVTQLLNQSEELVRTRMASEAEWTTQQRQHMDQLATVWRTELATLRDDEAQRGQAAVARLGELQTAVAGHLATLGAALEAPLTRLLQTASDVPQAAAEVIAQLRQEMAALSERDNAALSERAALMGQLAGLVQRLDVAAGQQQAAIDDLVGSAAGVLEQAGARFADALGAQAGKVDDVAAHVAASAVELGSLGEAFNESVTRFNTGSDKLVDSLQRIEAALAQSLSRSDEQLAYYVAQAREVIDLSIVSQQGILEDLRRLQAQAPAGAA